MSSPNNNVEINPRNNQEQATERSLKNLIELMDNNSQFRLLGEIAVSFIFFFQALYIQLSYNFPSSLAFIPLVLHSIIQIGRGFINYVSSTIEEENNIHLHSIANWGTIFIYQV